MPTRNVGPVWDHETGSDMRTKISIFGGVSLPVSWSHTGPTFLLCREMLVNENVPISGSSSISRREKDDDNADETL